MSNTKEHCGLQLSAGEKALIEAIRNAKVAHVWGFGSVLIDCEAVFEDAVSFLTQGNTDTDDVIREALNKISREQEQENKENND